MGGIFAQGTIVAYENPSSTWNTIPDVGDFEAPSEMAEDIDSTTHSSANARKEYTPGLIDSGEISLPINYNPANAHHNYFRNNVGSATPVNMRITWKGGATTTFLAVIKGFTRNAPVAGLYASSITLRKTGGFTETAA